jgi:hypothetical protein
VLFDPGKKVYEGTNCEQNTRIDPNEGPLQRVVWLVRHGDVVVESLKSEAINILTEVDSGLTGGMGMGISLNKGRYL